MTSFYKIYTAKAPVNIAVIKYWGKKDEKLKVPINDSISGTLDLNDLCATTTVAISDTFESDEFILNGDKVTLTHESHVSNLIKELRSLSSLKKEITSYKLHIVSQNNFPTAAGLASSAAGYACLAFVLGHAYGVTDPTQLSKIARRGSGSACRSLFGGFVQWIRGVDHESSLASQIVNQEHWPDMRVVICIISDHQKDVSSGDGMLLSVNTSQLIKYRSDSIVPSKIDAMKAAILMKDFETFAKITMQDSNQFHAICLDTYPPLFYLNDTSRQIIKICTIINAHYNKSMVAYTFDAGPNACIYLLEEFVPTFIAIIKSLFPVSNRDNVFGDLHVRGRPYGDVDMVELDCLLTKLQSKGITTKPNSINHLMHTSIGSGPLLSNKHLEDPSLEAMSRLTVKDQVQ